MYIVYIPKSPIDIQLPKIHTEAKAQEAMLNLAREFLFKKEGPEKSEKAIIYKEPTFPEEYHYCIVQNNPHCVEVHKKSLYEGYTRWTSGHSVEKVYVLEYSYCPDTIVSTPSFTPTEVPKNKQPSFINPFILELSEVMEKRRSFIEPLQQDELYSSAIASTIGQDDEM